MALTSDQRIMHLLRRAGYGPSQAEFDTFRAMSYQEAVNALVDDDNVQESLDPTGGQTTFDATKLDDWRRVWLYRMVNSKKQLREKLTYFWHDHFATNQTTVNNVDFMWRQNELFRSNAMADFKTLLLAVSKDPAMMTMLDTQLNSKNAPNENYAREIMELFSLGVGTPDKPNYTEADIKEAARCFTGWRYTRDGTFFIQATTHDSGIKTLFKGTTQERSGNFGGEDVVDLLVRHPACGPFIAGKLFRYFVSESPDESAIAQLAQLFYTTSYSIREVVRAIFLSDAFSAEANYHARIKNPVEHLVGLVKQLGLAASPVPFELPAMLREQSLDLLNPPSVKGWPDSGEWMGTTGLMVRANHVNKLVCAKGSTGKYFFDAVAYANATGRLSLDSLIGELLNRYLDADTTQNLVDRLKSYWYAGPRTASAELMAANPAPYTVYVPFAAAPGSGALSVTSWNGQTQKLRGLFYLILSSPTYQLN